MSEVSHGLGSQRRLKHGRLVEAAHKKVNKSAHKMNQLPWLTFAVIFLSFKANAREYLQTGHGHLLPPPLPPPLTFRPAVEVISTAVTERTSQCGRSLTLGTLRRYPFKQSFSDGLFVRYEFLPTAATALYRNTSRPFTRMVKPLSASFRILKIYKASFSHFIYAGMV